MRTHHIAVFAALVVVATGLVACKKKEPPRAPAPPVAQAPPAAPAAFGVTQVELGKQIGADKRVTEQVAVFAPADTIYATVLSSGTSPSVTLRARWLYEDGQVVNESSQAIAPSGPTVTEFHIAKPSGFPAGKYKVEIAANDAVVNKKEFEVR